MGRVISFVRQNAQVLELRIRAYMVFCGFPSRYGTSLQRCTGFFVEWKERAKLALGNFSTQDAFQHFFAHEFDFGAEIFEARRFCGCFHYEIIWSELKAKLTYKSRAGQRCSTQLLLYCHKVVSIVK